MPETHSGSLLGDTPGARGREEMRWLYFRASAGAWRQWASESGLRRTRWCLTLGNSSAIGLLIAGHERNG